MQSESKQENTTISITDEKPVLTAPHKASNIDEIRSITKQDSVKMIDKCLTTFAKIVEEGVTFEKCDALNEMIMQTFMLLDINLSNIIAIDDDFIYLNKEMKELNPKNMLPVYELVLWKRVNTQLDEQCKMGIMDNIEFLRDIKDYIINVCYKNVNVDDNKN